MKKLKLTLAGICILGMLSLVLAEESKPAAPAKAPAVLPAKAPAQVKKKVSRKDKTEPKKVVYKCEHCNTASDKPGKCPMCGMEMKKT